MDKSEIVYILFLVFTLPAAAAVKAFGGDSQREILGFLGFVVTGWLCGSVAHASVAIAASLMAVVPTSAVDKVVSLAVFAYLLPARVVFEGADGATNAMMLITALRMVMFACEVADGRTKHSVWNFLLFVYCLPGVLTGPLLDPASWELLGKARGPGDWRRAGVVVGKGALWGAANLLLIPVFNLMKSRTLGSWETLAILVVAPWYFRARCYFAWYLTEAAWSLLGVAGDVWGRSVLRNLGVERSLSIKEATHSWNTSVQSFFGLYVFKRLKGFNARRLATFIVSAWWHGTESGLYVFFLGICLVQAIEHHYNWLLPAWARWAVTNLVLNLLTSAFILKSDLNLWWGLSASTHHFVLLAPGCLAVLGVAIKYIILS